MSIREIKDKIVPILKANGVTRASIFGSFARGDSSSNSDVDILIDINRNISLLGIIEIKFKLEDALGKHVDLVEYNAIKPHLRKHILSEQVQIL